MKNKLKVLLKHGEKERHRHGEKIAQGHANMSLEAKLKESENKSKAQIERFAKLTFEDKIRMYLKNALMTNEACGIIPDKFDADTEKEFYWYMKNKGIRIGYHFYNLNIHPDFYKMFPYNPYSKYNYSSPFHEWDFVIWTYKTPILIDVDGSYHDPKLNNYNIPNKYKINENLSVTMHCYYDMRRPYQTDGYPAYSVLCYEDFFDGFNKVININDPSKEMNMLNLLSIISEYNDHKYIT